jgi:hypothetical protein
MLLNVYKMKKILSFDKPKKVRSTEEHNKMHTSDSGVAGTYVPNMSKADELKWKGKHIKGDDERVEIRKTIEGTQLLVIVYKTARKVKYDWNHVDEWRKRHENVTISMNGKLSLSWVDYYEMIGVINEADELMKGL